MVVGNYLIQTFYFKWGSEISLVLAMDAKGAEGLRHLSLYLCPRELKGKKNFHVLKLEKSWDSMVPQLLN